MLTEQELSELQTQWATSSQDYDRQAGIPDLFEAQVRQQPGAVALEQPDERLTYRQLEARANKLAHRLRELGAGPHSLCGICLPRSSDMVVAILAVLKAGAAYLPLDPASPVDRLNAMLTDAPVTVLLTHKSVAVTLAARLPALDVSTVLLDSGAPLIACQPEVPPARAPLADELAYVVYTSGSTGKPKGVMIEHRAVVNHLLALQRDYGLGEADTVLQLPSLAFHPSVRDILGPLCAGARLVLLEEAAASDPRAILGALQQHKVTCLLSLAPALGRALLAEPGTASLRLVLTCGELLRSEEARGLREKFGCEVANQFGPTECVMAACKHTFSPDYDHRPTVLAGRAEANARLYVLDADRRLLPAGLPGELYVAGEGLARGYLGQPELTAERFLPDTFSAVPGARMYRTGDLVRRLPDGDLEFLGRLEDQVEVRGLPVELGEVEAALGGHPDLREVAAAVRGERLAAYFVPAPASGPTAPELRAFLRDRLPAHMIPALFVALEQLPRTPNGKVDRRSLTESRPHAAARLRPPPNTRRMKTSGLESRRAAVLRFLGRRRAALVGALSTRSGE
jgi:amino acid adenylation domain-containing protein